MDSELGRIDFSQLPYWLAGIIFFLTLLPRALQGVAIFVPSLSVWLDSREDRKDAVVHAELEQKAFETSQSALLTTQLLNIVKQTLDERASTARDSLAALEKLERAIENQALHIERGNHMFTALNITISKLSDQVVDLGVRVSGLHGYVIGKDGHDPHRGYGSDG